MENRKTILAIDFDGTIVKHDYPNIGPMLKDADIYINKLHKEGFIIIIWSVRDGKDREALESFMKENSIHYDYINKNSKSFHEKLEEDSRYRIDYWEPRKIYADIYIDDKNLGGVFEWKKIYELIHEQVDEI